MTNTIVIKVVPKNKVRNQGIGDYKNNNGKLEILVAKNSGNKDEKIGVAIHELVEAVLAQKRKISFKEIDKFDRDNIKHPDPGSKKDAPYRQEHKFANKIEAMVVKELKKKNG